MPLCPYRLMALKLTYDLWPEVFSDTVYFRPGGGGNGSLPNRLPAR